MKRLLLSISVIVTGYYRSVQSAITTNPDQAPIDGGLGLLAAAGGAYAYKKLKGKKNQEDASE